MAHGKRYRSAAETVEAEKAYGVSEAIKLVKSNATSKFDETIEIAVNLGVDPKYADQMVRGMVSLPSGTGKDVRVAVFARDAKAEEAKKAAEEEAKTAADAPAEEAAAEEAPAEEAAAEEAPADEAAENKGE